MSIVDVHVSYFASGTYRVDTATGQIMPGASPHFASDSMVGLHEAATREDGQLAQLKAIAILHAHVADRITTAALSGQGLNPTQPAGAA